MRLYDILRPIAEYVSKAKKRETLRASGTVRAYVKTREQEGTVVLSGYGFVSGTYNYRGSLIAVEI